MSLQALVISDSAVSRTNARRALESAGFATTILKPEDDATPILEERTLALIVLALPEPPRLATLRRMRGTPAVDKVPILVVVESRQVLPRVQAIHAGARDCIAEPYDPTFLAACAAGLVSSHELRKPRAAGGPGRILVVDDSATYSTALAEELRRDGHDVVVASGAAEALELLAIESVDEVVLDVFMPDVGGVELCSRIRARTATHDVPVLMLTGRKDTTLKETGLAAGADDFVVKSGDFDLIRSHVGGLLRHAATARAARGQRKGTSTLPPPPSSTRVEPASSKRDSSLPKQRDSAVPSVPRSQTFLDRVVAATGLSSLMGKSSVTRACGRAGLAVEELSPANLDRVLPHLNQTLRVFLDPGAADARTRAVAELGAREAGQAREA